MATKTDEINAVLLALLKSTQEKKVDKVKSIVQAKNQQLKNCLY